jgi:hypothetical protein
MLSACAARGQTDVPRRPRPIESDISVIGGHTVGAVQLVAVGQDRQLDLLGVQYARHSWGGLLGARVDYLAEVIPMLLMHEPAQSAPDSTPLTSARRTVYGADIVPIGCRLMWLGHQRLKPYLQGSGGVVYFTDRVISPEGERLNFTAEFGAGAQMTLTDRLGLRAGYSLFHVSNGDRGRRNPGLDTNMIYVAAVFELRPKARR